MDRAQLRSNNITLIGMPGAGKSTVGVLLAKTTGRDFIDTDILLQNRYGKLLPELIRQYGWEGFIEREAEIILSLSCDRTVIAPGGSVIYSELAMAHLQAISMVYYLQLSLPAVTKRLHNLRSRGILMQPGQGLASLYEERTPLYAHYADRVLNSDGKSSETILAEMISLHDQISADF